MPSITTDRLLVGPAGGQSDRVTHPHHLPPPHRFEGRSVLVTGAGTGFGRAIALRATQEGARAVGIHYRSSKTGAEETAAQVTALGGEARLFQADIAEWNAVKAFAAEVFST